MNFDTFDNDAEGTTDEDYFAFVAWLTEQTAFELRESQGNPTAQKQALCRYYGRGYRANLTPAELIDFLPLDEIGYSAAEIDALMQISDGLTEEEIRSVALP